MGITAPNASAALALGRPVLTATADAGGTAPLPLPRGLARSVRVGSQALRLVVEER